jgi:mono/diheme cytochrome c family protein
VARCSSPTYVSTRSALLLVLLQLSARTASGEELIVPAERGAELFQQYCVLCHGDTGHGDGRAALLQKTRPSDLTRSTRSDAYKLQMIRNGGQSLGRSAGMPAWSQVLSAEDIENVVAFLRTLAQPAVAKEEATSQVIETR